MLTKLSKNNLNRTMFSQSECFLHTPQDFLVCTTVHKAKNLPIFNADTYVRVSLNKKSKSTKVFQNSENPFYNEYFVFDFSCTLAELLRLTVLYEVKKKTCKNTVTLGELLIDLYTVWNQEHKCFVKKWGKLENSIGSKNEARGHLQIDLAIVTSNQIPTLPTTSNTGDNDDIESNLLQSMESPPRNIKYSIFFYKGVFSKKSDYILQVSLAGMNVKTTLVKGTQLPEWNQEIQFDWSYPSLAQTFIIQVLSHEHMTWKSIAESEIYIDEIDFKDEPNLGPTFIHFYDGNSYVGRILMQIKSEKMCVVKDSTNRVIHIKQAQPMNSQIWWSDENFYVEFVVLRGEFIHANSSNLKILFKMGEFTSNYLECFLKSYDGASTSLKHFTQDSPYKAIHIKCTLPDTRFKYDIDNFIITLVEQMNIEMENFELLQLKDPQNDAMHCKCLKAIISSTLTKVHDLTSDSKKQRLSYTGLKPQTVWDENRLAYLKEYFGTMSTSLKDLRQYLKVMHNGGAYECVKVFEELQHLKSLMSSIIQSRIQDAWPELQLYMCLGDGKPGCKEIGICKLESRYFSYCQREECHGPGYNLARNFVFKDPACSHTCKECGCIRGYIYGLIRISTEAEQSNANDDWHQTEQFYYEPKIDPSSYICRVYLHQAKIRPGTDKTGLCDAKLLIFINGQVIETSTIFTSLSPVWNTSMMFASRQLPGPVKWYERNPLLLGIQAFDMDTAKQSDYLGSGLVALSVTSSSNRRESLKTLLGNSEVGNSQMNSTNGFDFRSFVKTKNALRELREVRFKSPPSLQWVALSSMGTSRIEVLISGELLQVRANEAGLDATKTAVMTEGLPPEIQPTMKKFLLEVTFIGLRNCQKLSSCSSSLGRYRILVLMGECVIKSGVSGSALKNSINFLDSFQAGVVNLPEQIEYWPAIIATHTDWSKGITLGAALIPNPRKYLQKDADSCDMDDLDESIIIQMGEGDDESAPLLPKKKSILKKSFSSHFKEYMSLPSFAKNKSNANQNHMWIDETEFSWWTKFYNSMFMQNQKKDSSPKHSLVVYDCELEKQPEFSFLCDWAETFNLVHGITVKKNKPPREQVYANLKMHLKISACYCNEPSSVTLNSVSSKVSRRYQSANALNDVTKVIVRVYVVQGLQLRSHDAQSEADAFVKLQLGSTTISDRSNYITNQSNPIFGKRFQMEAVIPRDHILQISIFDRGVLCDDLIGSTFIDLENRWRTQHRATVGIANEYNRTGYNIWRDAMTPYELLREMCKKYNLGTPIFQKNSVELDGVTFTDTTEISIDEDLQERLSLSILKGIHELPSFGKHLVPEHVETRSLYRSDRPGVEQGKLQLWIELFDAVQNLPAPIDITPTPPGGYELRVIIYNCADVVFNEKNIFGTKMSDIYIKAWCENNDASQSTDVHHRSLNGEGNFNWRMIFPLKYSAAEDMMIIKRKGSLLENYEIKQPPMLFLQIWDNDSFSADDFMGALDVCLSHFDQPFENKKSCTLTPGQKKKRKRLNLFREKNVKGWFPVNGPSEEGGGLILAGKIEMELEILTESEAGANPAGLGRNPPNALPAPERPETSFNPMFSPLKSLKHILGPAVRKCLLYSCAFVLILGIVFSAIAGLV